MSYHVRWSSVARRAIENTLPESVAAAVREFVNGALAENPHRVGKELVGPKVGTWSARRGQYRVRYKIDDDGASIVTVLDIDHRRDVHRA